MYTMGDRRPSRGWGGHESAKGLARRTNSILASQNLFLLQGLLFDAASERGVVLRIGTGRYAIAENVVKKCPRNHQSS